MIFMGPSLGVLNGRVYLKVWREDQFVLSLHFTVPFLGNTGGLDLYYKFSVVLNLNYD